MNISDMVSSPLIIAFGVIGVGLIAGLIITVVKLEKKRIDQARRKRFHDWLSSKQLAMAIREPNGSVSDVAPYFEDAVSNSSLQLVSLSNHDAERIRNGKPVKLMASYTFYGTVKIDRYEDKIAHNDEPFLHVYGTKISLAGRVYDREGVIVGSIAEEEICVYDYPTPFSREAAVVTLDVRTPELRILASRCAIKLVTCLEREYRKAPVRK